MGRVKTALVKRTSRALIEKAPDKFSPDFSENKLALAKTMPSKKMRNIVAGYLTRLNKNTKKIIEIENDK